MLFIPTLPTLHSKLILPTPYLPHLHTTLPIYYTFILLIPLIPLTPLIALTPSHPHPTTPSSIPLNALKLNPAEAIWHRVCAVSADGASKKNGHDGKNGVHIRIQQEKS